MSKDLSKLSDAVLLNAVLTNGRVYDVATPEEKQRIDSIMANAKKARESAKASKQSMDKSDEPVAPAIEAITKGAAQGRTAAKKRADDIMQIILQAISPAGL